MVEVKIPFLPQFKEAMLNGKKTMTSRTKKYGKVNDTFEAFGSKFVITEVGRLELGDITSFWKEEGFSSLDEFVDTWKKIHPNRPYRLNDRFYYHRFKKETNLSSLRCFYKSLGKEGS